MSIRKIALLGQPNSGKSTIFNALTGSNQHVGNWPGKTVEKIEGEFSYGGADYLAADLPGTYSLSANSDEEVITRDYIADGGADLVCVLADASQLERSFFMLADFAGIRTPSLLVLTMIDVAEQQGKKIDCRKLADKLGIPVVPLVATDRGGYEDFYRALDDAMKSPRTLDEGKLVEHYRSGERRAAYEEALKLIPADGIDKYSAPWLAAKLMEGDRIVAGKIAAVSDPQKVEAFLAAHSDGSLYTSDCKFAWIEELLRDTATKDPDRGEILTRFDRIAISRRWGKPVAIGIVLLGVVLSMVAAAPIMGLGGAVPVLLRPLVERIGLSGALTSLINDVLVNSLSWTLAMVGFVFGINLVFGFIEEIGYMARVSYVFDNTMNKLGLQGKSVMPMLVSFGCTIGGVAGSRVIDSWGQRVLTIALAWAVPCGATFAVIPTLSNAIFGDGGGILVMLFLFAIMFVHIAITARIFGRTLSPVNDRIGLIMELPPYHKPRWKNLIRTTLSRVWGVFKRAIQVIATVSAVFWLLTYSASGAASDSLFYRFGTAIEPLTRFFGMGWQTFIAFCASMFSKEAVLGVTSVLFTGSGSIMASAAGIGVDANIGAIMASSISKPEALAFIVAVTFNVPCLLALSSTLQETHSLKWTLRIALYYIASALILSALTFHIAGLFF